MQLQPLQAHDQLRSSASECQSLFESSTQGNIIQGIMNEKEQQLSSIMDIQVQSQTIVQIQEQPDDKAVEEEH